MVPLEGMAEAVDVVVIGGGAAGLMCAMTAGRRRRRVVVLEHNAEPGKKILISGGGRCNFTNLNTRPEHFLGANPHFPKSALARYTPRDFVDMVERHGIPYHEKEAGQLFCDRSAREILDMLLRECADAGVVVRSGCRVDEVAESFRVRTTAGELRAKAVVVATGGLSIPKIGATGLGYDIARQYGLGIAPCRPGLVPWTFAHEQREVYGVLAGVAAEAEVRTARASFRGRALFTHRGLSGPAVLQASSYWCAGEAVSIDWAPGADIAALLREARAAGSKAEARTLAARVLPKRMAEIWASDGRVAASLPDREIGAIADSIHRWRFVPAGTEGYEKAEVTAGGVDTVELSSKTMESVKVPGLYFIGEVVDVTGHLGGFNFQWAWSSGWAAGSVA
jgi:predicted Rossmann fold flavoprotein